MDITHTTCVALYVGPLPEVHVVPLTNNLADAFGQRAKPKPKRAQLGSAASRIFHFHGLFIAANVAARVELCSTYSSYDIWWVYTFLIY